MMLSIATTNAIYNKNDLFPNQCNALYYLTQLGGVFGSNHKISIELPGKFSQINGVNL